MLMPYTAGVQELIEAHLWARDTFEGAFDLTLNQSTVNGTHVSHDHDFWEIALIAGGEGVHVGRGGETPARRGAAFFLRPGAWHAYRECQGLDVRNVCWSDAFMGRELAGLRHDPVLAAHLQSWRSPAWRGETTLALPDEEFAPILTHWNAAQAAPTPVQRIAHTLLVFEALWRSVPVERERTKALHPAVEACARLFQHHPARPWTLAELGQRAHLSPEHLAREFKSALGISPMEFLARERLERAAARLLQSDDSLARIGQSVGYDDPNYFARRFRAHFGVSPRDYRKRFS